MIVYARKEKTYIWSDNNSSHKAGWVPIYEPLDTDGERPSGWYAIARPLHISLPIDPSYPDYWVKVGDTVAEVPPPEPDPILISDTDAAVAIIALLKWWKQQ